MVSTTFEKGGVVIIDDSSTASESDVEYLGPSPGASGRVTPAAPPEDVKCEPGLEDYEEKILWTDDSGDDDKISRGKRKRRSVAGGSKRASRGRPPKKTKARDNDPPSNDELAEAGVPDYLQKRRKVFQENLGILKEAGLRLPPDYEHIRFEGDDRLGELEERPKFDESSGVKPCRPYHDIELEHSGGFIPASIAQFLRDYQIQGARFLHRLFVYQRGGILGDDMGLGKTIQVIAFLTAAFGKTGDERDSKRMRAMRRDLVCPGTLITNWRNELNRWGWWHIDACHGPTKEDALMTARSGLSEILITTYHTYKLNKSSINGIEWDAVIADECHVLKDHRSETTKAMNEVNALCRIGLTGTAIQNSYDEFWTLLNWSNPGRYGSLSEWTSTISRPLTIGQSHDATRKQLSLARITARKLVQNLLPPVFLRRMKTLIAHQLPKKTDKVVFCPLTDIQREAYQTFLESDEVMLLRTASEPCDCGTTTRSNTPTKKGWCCYKRLPNGRPWQSIVFPAMMSLQKLASHLCLMVPSSLDLAEKQNSELHLLRLAMPDTWEDLYSTRDSIIQFANPDFCGKWKVLKKLLKFWHANGDKVLVFSHSVKLLRILQALFSNTSYSTSYLDGSLSYEDRQRVVDDFNSDPSQFLFLISSKAGGVGLNIVSANKVVIFDPHWNPSYDLQAQDRAYRIGQTRDVDVFRLISSHTIEEVVYGRQIYKQQQANIGYNATSERRYFKGVQKDEDRKGEIFGLSNIFTFHGNQIRDIINKTNIAEAKAGVSLMEVDIEQAIKDEGIDAMKNEGSEEDFVALVTAEDKEAFLSSKRNEKPKSDAVQAILASAGVEYTHDNSEVLGTSKAEQQLSRRAELAGESDAGMEGDSVLFADSEDEGYGRVQREYLYNPPEDVMKRQFCSMAKEFGFSTATEFALAVEGMTQEGRRNCLDTFYRRRAAALLGNSVSGTPRPAEAPIKHEEPRAMSDVTTRISTPSGARPVKDEKTEDGDEWDFTPAAVVKSEKTGPDVKLHPDYTEEKPVGLGTKAESPDEVKVKVESGAKVSVFLSDDDDDEL
ncbi:related to DNA repair protein RAD26 [Cephalotrichum gorgonifer]|uniref:Related to DNA repair protein RAD26 n=1 Tax=Cephalotrichum gorgonifer TaxID=2041049 RepID=A0AAE8MRU1_9PEZI|nr:related to DNA repair protein RAD26 [Cephalotrichum gorgonifer]